MTRKQTEIESTRDYRVQLTTWETHEIRIYAADEACACRNAENIWHDIGPEAFSYRDGGVDDVRIVDAREVDA